MRRITWLMTRFFSTVGRESVGEGKRVDLGGRPIIEKQRLNKARRVRPALKYRLVRKEAPGRQVRMQESDALRHNKGTVVQACTLQNFQLARLVLRDRRGRKD